MKSKLLNKNLYIMELPYKIVYFIFAIFTYCNLTFMQPIMSVAVNATLLFGAFAIGLRVFKLKGYLKTPGLVFAIAFFVSFIISALLNIEYGYADNFKGLVWMGLHFFTIFACDTDRDIEDYKKEFNVIAIFYLAVFFVMSFVGIIQYIMNYSFEQYNESYTRLAGFVWGRLWGMYRDPNYGSVFATIAVAFSIYYFRKNKNTILRSILVFNIAIQIIYIALSGSRTGMLTVFVCLFCYSYLLLIKKFKLKKVINVTLSVIISVSVAVAAVVVISGVQQVNSIITEMRMDNDSDDPKDSPDFEELREQDLENDISNRRFDLWKSGIEIFAQKPVFGVSFYNLQQYALEEMPETYLVNNDHGLFNNMHNMIFNIIPAQGTVGTLIFIGLAVFAVVYIFKNIFKEDENYEYLVIMTVCVACSLVSSMFVSDVIYVNSPTSLLFWLFLGYMFHYFYNKRGNGVKKGVDL